MVDYSLPGPLLRVTPTTCNGPTAFDQRAVCCNDKPDPACIRRTCTLAWTVVLQNLSMTFTHPTRLWEACKQLRAAGGSRRASKCDGPSNWRSLADVSLNHSRCISRRTEEVDDDALSFTSASTTGTCTKLQGDAHLVEWWSASPEASPQPSTPAEWPNRHGGLTIIGLMESTAGRP